MNKDEIPASLYRLLVFVFFLIPGYAYCAVPECPAGTQVLWYFPEERLDEGTSKGFSRGLFSELTAALSSIGYCLTPFNPRDTVVRAPAYAECLVMRLYQCDVNDDQGEEYGGVEKELFVSLAKTKEWNASAGDSSVFRTLFSLRYFPTDLSTIETIFVKKLIENLRTQYICSIAITTDPKGAQIIAMNGLNDHTPLEWVLPVGTLTINCTMKKYLPLEKELTFSNPGSYSYLFQMRKRQFYHSKTVYPAAVAAIASGIALVYKYYYYNQYNGFRKMEHDNTPEVFAQTFRKVQTCERISLASIILSGAFLGLSFRF
jgi:hypothetical protein